MADIAAHKDSGKRSLLHIGIGCGYPKEKVEETIKICRSIGGCLKQERYYYFFLKKNGQDHIICLDTEDWSADSIKKIDNLQEDCMGIREQTYGTVGHTGYSDNRYKTGFR